MLGLLFFALNCQTFLNCGVVISFDNTMAPTLEEYHPDEESNSYVSPTSLSFFIIIDIIMIPLCQKKPIIQSLISQKYSSYHNTKHSISI